MWVLLRYEARVAYTTMHVYEIPEISVQKKFLLWNNTHKIYKIEKFFPQIIATLKIATV